MNVFAFISQTLSATEMSRTPLESSCFELSGVGRYVSVAYVVLEIFGKTQFGFFLHQTLDSLAAQAHLVSQHALNIINAEMDLESFLFLFQSRKRVG